MIYNIEVRETLIAIDPSTGEKYELGGPWHSDGLGETPEFSTKLGAKHAIDALRALGGGWADADYRIRAENGETVFVQDSAGARWTGGAR
jgi:hypothetical protein